MNKSLEIKNIIVLLLLLCIGVQVKAQQATTVEVFREDFEGAGFTGNYISTKPTGERFDFLDDIDFTYYTTTGGQLASGYGNAGYCIIATNSNQIGHGPWDHPAMDTYCLYAVSDGNAKKIYTKTISATKGEQVEFGIYYRDVDGNYSFRIEATGDGLSGSTARSDEFYKTGNEWNHYTYTVTATATGNITFNVVDISGTDRADKMHKFGIDNITITKKAIRITQPTTAVRCTPSTLVPLEAKYEQVSSGYSYTWQKFNSGNWEAATAATGTATGSGATNEFTTAAISVTENTAGIYNYRLAVTDNASKTYYSDIITVEYTSIPYIFREDFGGNFPSTASTNQGVSGASGDWWIMPGDQPTITTDFTYGDQDGTEYDNRDLAEKAYGRIPIKLDYGGETNGEARYAITKIAGYNLPLPGYSDKTWKWGDHNDSKGAIYDHTISGEDARGYYMYAANRTSQDKVVYQSTLPTTGMAGKAFKLSAWQVAVWGNQGKEQFKLEVLDASNTVIKAASFEVTNDWQERSLSFYLPTNYTSDISLRISSFGGSNLWLGLDDISLVEEEINLDIILPASGSTVGVATDFVVNYKYISSSPIYKWQYSADGTTGWTDIAGTGGSLSSDNGTFITEVPVTTDGYYYRVLITDGGDTNYTKAISSGAVMLNKSTEYVFMDDFGGATASTSTTKDWWITQGKGAVANLPQLYRSDYQYTEDVGWIETEDIANHPHGMEKTLYLFNDRFAITKVSGKMAEVKYENGNPVPIMLADQKIMFDHTTPADETGYYLLTRGWGDGKTIYAHTHSYLAPGNYAYRVWLAGASTDLTNLINVELRAEVDGNTVTLPVTITNQEWTEYTLPFYTDGSATTISIVQVGDHKGNAIFGVDDITIGNPVPKIIIPNAAEVCVLENRTISLTGEYKYVAALGSTVTYTWETSTNGTTDWNTVDTSTGTNTDKGGSPTGTPTYTTDEIDETVYYRFVVSGNGIDLASEPIRIITGKWPKERTYYVCPDNITQEEIDTKGYLPSLIDLAMPDLYVIYKWYTTETGGTPLKDIDDYQTGQKRGENIVYTDDGKTNTISVENDHSTQGDFTDRTYWVEVCQMNGTPYSQKRIPVYVRKAYICASLDPVVSKDNSTLINRESFGGTSSDPRVSPTPPPGINVDYNFYDQDDEKLPEGDYMLTKKSPETTSGWSSITNHYYNYDFPETERAHGYLFMANATPEPGRFYTHQLTNLGDCRNLELTFSGWFASPVNWQGSEKANLKFILTDTDMGDVLAEFTTGNLIDAEIKWRQYGFKFFVPTGVTNITLEIINNNFGTTGGNDMVMDDIEIYLNIPPVTLVPDGDSYVCPDYTEVSLKGQYYDDGTLGDNLDYRWEYEDPIVGWTYITYTDSENREQIAAGSVQKGTVTPTVSEYFIKEFTDAHNGNYRLVVGQKGAFGSDYKTAPNYDCVAVSNTRRLTLIVRSDRILRPSLSGLTAYCHDDEIVITNTEQNSDVVKYDQYEWQLDGKTIASAEDYDDIVTGITLQAEDYTPGYYTLALNVHNDVGCFYYSIHEFVIYPQTTTWTAGGDPENWNDADNWSAGVPGDCTDVIIPNDDMNFLDGVQLLGHYPVLKTPSVETLNGMNTTGGSYDDDQKNLEKQTLQNDPDFYLRPACDNIHFEMGGSVARTDYLNYTDAAVDLNIEPGRWYTLSAPLRAMYSGDYFVDGNVADGKVLRKDPTVFMMKYNTTNPQTQEVAAIAGGFTNPFNTLTEDLYPGLGYAVRVDTGTKPEDELQPFSFPRKNTKYDMWNYHGGHLGETKTLSRTAGDRFTYEKHITMNGNLPAAGTTGFQVDVTNDKSEYTTMIVGNPFMGYLDFAAFKNANSGIDDGYYIWTSGETFDADLPGFDDAKPNAIAPMQSFIVKKKENTGKIEELNFNFSMSISAPSSIVLLRSAATTRAAAPAILKLEVLRNDIIQSNIRIKYNPAEKNEYSPHKDMWTLFSKDITHPAVLYTLLNGKAASIRTLGDLSKPIELGIRTNTFGPLTFRISGTETLDPTYDIYLEDRLTGVSHNLREEPEYTFSNQTGNVQGRFYLRMGDAITGIEDIESSESDIQVVTNKKQIIITSSMKDPIELVKIYSTQGQLLYEQQSIGQSTHTIDMPLQNQMVIVMIKTSMHQKQEKVVVR